MCYLFVIFIKSYRRNYIVNFFKHDLILPRYC
jgi:hypothetical protein